MRGKPFPALINATVDDIRKGLEQKQFTTLELVHVYISRIKEVNSTLNVVTEINPDALVIAAELDAERAKGITRGFVVDELCVP